MVVLISSNVAFSDWYSWKIDLVLNNDHSFIVLYSKASFHIQCPCRCIINLERIMWREISFLIRIITKSSNVAKLFCVSSWALQKINVMDTIHSIMYKLWNINSIGCCCLNIATDESKAVYIYRTDNTIAKRQKDKDWSTKHYTENHKLSSTTI